MKRTYLLGSVILGILAILIVAIVLTATGVFGGKGVETLVFSTANAESAYNGKALANDSWELISGELQEGHTVKANVYGAQTEVGESDNLMSVKILDENNADVTEDYQIEYRPGKLKVTQRPIKLLSGSATKQYDGTPISNSTYQIVSGGVVSGHTLSVDFGAERTEVGTDDNIVTVYVFDANGADVTSNYAIEAISGKLTISGYPLSIQTPSASVTYNGEALVNATYEHIGGELKNGDRMVVTVIGSQTNVGTSENDFQIQIFSKDGVDVTSHYEVTKVLGTLEVKPRQILVTTEGKTVVYTGETLENKVYNVEGSLAQGHTIDVSVTGKVTGVGSADNTFFAEIRDKNGNIVTGNYEIHTELGKLEILPVDIVIISSDAYKKYDGTPLVSSDYEFSIGRLLPGHILNVVVTGKQEKVGAVENTFVYKILDVNGNDVTGIYEVEAVFGTLEVEPLKITITTRGETKEYDGTPLILRSPLVLAGETFTHS